MPPQDSEQARWFALNLAPHIPKLRAWLATRYPSISDTEDVMQDAFVRVLHAQELQPLLSPKAFLFATARNLALDRLRRGEHRHEHVGFEVLDQELADEQGDAAERFARRQEVEILREAIAELPERCREIFVLRKVHGLSQADIAKRLGIAEKTVTAQLVIGFRKCSERVRQRTQARQKGAA